MKPPPPAAEARARNWRTGGSHRYCHRDDHDPLEHRTRAHNGARTATQTLIYLRNEDQWELFDLASDSTAPDNRHGQPESEALTAPSTQVLVPLKHVARDNDRQASEQLPNGGNGAVAGKVSWSARFTPKISRPVHAEAGGG